MPRPRRLSSSSSLTRSPSRLSFSSSSAAATAVAAVRNEHTRIYTCLIAGGLLLLASVTFLQAHLASAPQGSNLDPLDSDSNSGIYLVLHPQSFSSKSQLITVEKPQSLGVSLSDDALGCCTTQRDSEGVLMIICTYLWLQLQRFRLPGG